MANIFAAELPTSLSEPPLIIARRQVMAFVRRFGGDTPYVSMGKSLSRRVRDNRIRDDRKQGMTLTQLARRHELSRVRVCEIIHEQP